MKSIGNKYAELLMNIVLSVYSILETLGPQYLEEVPIGRKWSKKQIIGHLIDSAYNNHQRIIRAENQGNLTFQGYDQDTWVELNNYAHRDPLEVLECFFFVQKQLGFLIANLSDATLTYHYTHHNLYELGMNHFSKKEPACLSYLVWSYISHLEHHLKQLIPDYVEVLPSEYYK